jgi:hypothetical protein
LTWVNAHVALVVASAQRLAATLRPGLGIFFWTPEKAMRSSVYARLLVFVVLLLCGCTSTAYHPQLVQQPQHGYRAIAVGPITAKDEELWHGYAVLARRALIAQLIKSHAFEQVLETVPEPLPVDTIKVTGEITEFDKGNTALRWIIGFGAGRARVVGDFRIAEPAGGVLLQFTTSKEYAGGAGMGGANLVSFDELAEKLGEAAADAIEAWGKTGRLP